MTLLTKNSKKSSAEELDGATKEYRARREARRALLSFAQYTQPEYLTPPHIIDLANHLEAIERGELKRLIVVMPPRHGKSELVSLLFPCWYLAKHPHDYIVQAGYAESIALTHSRKARDIFITPAMTHLWPNIRHRPERAGQEMVIPERQAAHEWGTKQGGSYYAVGIGGGLTGRGFNVGIIDDPVKDAEEANSETIRQKVWDWYTMVFTTRQAPNAAIIIVMTRWHEDDLVGRLLKLMDKVPGSDQWTVLHNQAIDKDNKALWPERYSLEWLQNLRAGQVDDPDEPGQGSRAFEALYQGNPTVAEGQIFKREWWKHYGERPNFIRRIHSWDTAFKEKKLNDYSVCTNWGETEKGYLLLDVFRKKMEFPALKRAVKDMYARDIPDVVLVEDAASGQSLAQELAEDTTIPIVRVKVDKDKVARAFAQTPSIEAGKVLIPETAPWLFDYIEELSGFPNAEHDDQVDSTTQALAFLRAKFEYEETETYDTLEGEDVNMDLG